MRHFTASPLPAGRTFALPAPTPASQSHYESWRRPACTDACSRQRVLVSEDGFRGWRDVVTHDHAAYERRLEATVVALAALASRGASPTLASTVAVLGALTASLKTRIETGPLVVDLLADTVDVDGRRVLVGPVEWDILVVLARRLGDVVSYDDVTAWIWPVARLHNGRPRSCQPSRQSLRAAIARLREHLGAAGALLVTVPRVGVMLHAEASTGGA